MKSSNVKVQELCPNPSKKKSFIFFHITVIQCPAVASIHDYISTNGGWGVGGGGGGGEKGAMHDSCFFFKKEGEKRREEIRIIKKRLKKEKILCI